MEVLYNSDTTSFEGIYVRNVEVIATKILLAAAASAALFILLVDSLREIGVLDMMPETIDGRIPVAAPARNKSQSVPENKDADDSEDDEDDDEDARLSDAEMAITVVEMIKCAVMGDGDDGLYVMA